MRIKIAETLNNILKGIATEKQQKSLTRDFRNLFDAIGSLEDEHTDIASTMGTGGRIQGSVKSGNVEIDKTVGLRIYNPVSGNLTVALENTGDARFGSKLGLPGSTSFALFSQAQTYNGEQMGEGDQLLGDNSASKANLLWDRSAGTFRLRSGTTDSIVLGTDGKLSLSKAIESIPYSAGYQGFNIDAATGNAEFNNIIARGILRSAVFQKDVVSAVGGTLAVLDSDVLSVDMTALDASTLTIEGNTTFAVGDMLRMKDGVDDEWFEVTNIGSAPTYTVTRDKGAAYAANSNPAWTKGATVVNYGASGEGGMILEAGSAPRLRIFNHGGKPWLGVDVDPDGIVYDVELDEDGLRIEQGQNDVNKISWMDGATILQQLSCHTVAGLRYGELADFGTNLLVASNHLAATTKLTPTGRAEVRTYYDYANGGNDFATTRMRAARRTGDTAYLEVWSSATDGQYLLASGDFKYYDDLIAKRGATDYTGYIYVPLTSPLTSASWDGDSFSTTAKTKIDLSAVFGVPAGVKAVEMRVICRDSGSAGDSERWIGFDPANGTNIAFASRCGGLPNDFWADYQGKVPCDANGDIYYQASASGAGTLDVYIFITGYYI